LYPNPKSINQSTLILTMSAFQTRYIPNFSICFSCEKLQSPTPRCDCGFNVDIVCDKLMGLCMRKELTNINYLAFIIESFTLKHVKKISSKFGYVSSISLSVAAKVCAIEFAMRGDWFKFGNSRDMLYAAVSEVEHFADLMRQDTQNARMLVWNACITDRRILTPPAIGALRQDTFRSKLTFAQHIQTQFALGRTLQSAHTQIMLLPDHVTYTVRVHPIRRNGATVVEEIRQTSDAADAANRQAEAIRQALAASLETQRIEREKQIAENNVKTWKSISIITNVLEKSEDVEGEGITCPICCDNIIHSKKSRTNCGHTVCSDCVSDMITKCGSKCVMCRSVITSVEFGSIAEIVKCQETKIQILSV
jgi:hypothetical protein